MSKVEVYIPTRNSERTIEKCLRSIFSAIPDASVTLVDRYSTDRTVEEARKFGAKVIQGDLNLGRARELMCGSAQDEWFVMVDSDTYLKPDWYEKISSFRNSVDDGSLGIIQGLNEPMYERYRSWWQQQIRKIQFPQINPGRVLTCNVLIRTKAVRGFKCDLPVYEDYALTNYVREKGFKSWVTDKARAYHDNPTLESKDARWGGAGAVYTGAIPLWKFFVGIFYGGLLKTEWGWKWYSAKLYWNWFVGGLFKSKYLEAKK